MPAGLASTSTAAAAVLDAAGFDLILIETVGTGQSEVEVAAAADTTVVLEAPEMGDEVQAIKAGLLEVADLVVVNKGDKPGAQRTAAQLRAMLVATATRDADPSTAATQAARGPDHDGRDRRGRPRAPRGARPAPCGRARGRLGWRPPRPGGGPGLGDRDRPSPRHAAGRRTTRRTEAVLGDVAEHHLDPYARRTGCRSLDGRALVTRQADLTHGPGAARNPGLRRARRGLRCAFFVASGLVLPVASQFDRGRSAASSIGAVIALPKRPTPASAGRDVRVAQAGSVPRCRIATRRVTAWTSPRPIV